MAKEIIVTADKIYNRKKRVKKSKLIGLVIFVLMTVTFLILSIIYKGGRFVITLDNNLALESGLFIYDNSETKESKRRLYADEIKFLDNISIKWLPDNIHNEKEGSHNGTNYLAYTFYLENSGKRTINYWYEIVIDDVIKNVDDAIRIIIFRNGEKEIYAKTNAYTKEPEPNTKPFYKKDKDTAILESRNDFKPKDIDKFTVVIFLDGDDPECVNNIIGGEIKLHMNIKEEHKEN